MGDKRYTPTAGLRNVGSYQVSGTPYVTSSTIASGEQKKIEFPSVTNNVTVQLSNESGGGTEPDTAYYVSARDGGGGNANQQSWGETRGYAHSISFWGKAEAASLSVDEAIVGLSESPTSPVSSSDGTGIFLSLTPSATSCKLSVSHCARSASYPAASSGSVSTSIATPDVRQWLFYTMVFTSGSAALYINNVKQGTLTLPVEQYTQTEKYRYLAFGDPYASDSNSAMFKYRDLVLWNRPLSSTDRATIYNNGNYYNLASELAEDTGAYGFGMMTSITAGDYDHISGRPSNEWDGTTSHGLRMSATPDVGVEFQFRFLPGWPQVTAGGYGNWTFMKIVRTLGSEADTMQYKLSDADRADASIITRKVISMINGALPDSEISYPSDGRFSTAEGFGFPGLSASASPTVENGVDIQVDPAWGGYVSVPPGSYLGWPKIRFFWPDCYNRFTHSSYYSSPHATANHTQLNWFSTKGKASKLIWYKFDTALGDTTSLVENRSTDQWAASSPSLTEASASIRYSAKGEYVCDVPDGSGYPSCAADGVEALISFKPTGSAGVLSNKHYWRLIEPNDQLTLNIKAKEIYLSSIGGNCNYSIHADLTTIPTGSMFDLTGSGIDS